MTRRKRSSSQVSWAVLTEGVTSSRLEAYRLRQALNRCLSLVENSEKKDHLYQVAGDLISTIPERMNQLEESLDKTAYALTILGKDFLKTNLSIVDRTHVEDSLYAVKVLEAPEIKEAHENPTPEVPSCERVAKLFEKLKGGE